MRATQRVIVTGATGLIGAPLCRRLREFGYSLVVLSRRLDKARQTIPGALDYIVWPPRAVDADEASVVAAMDGALGVIHLAGAPVFGPRWTTSYKRKILESRVDGTRSLVEAMTQATVKPRVFISASAIGIYGFRDATPLDETATFGDDFLAQVCQAWEASALAATGVGVRTVLARIGITLDAKAGAFPLMALPIRLGLGGPILPGTQWVSWAHIDDVVDVLLWALTDDRLQGPVNIVAPDARTNRDFMAALGRVAGRPSWLPVPGLALRLLLGGFATTLTTGQRVTPTQLQTIGYPFKYPLLDDALRKLLR